METTGLVPRSCCDVRSPARVRPSCQKGRRVHAQQFRHAIDARVACPHPAFPTVLRSSFVPFESMVRREKIVRKGPASAGPPLPSFRPPLGFPPPQPSPGRIQCTIPSASVEFCRTVLLAAFRRQRPADESRLLERNRTGPHLHFANRGQATFQVRLTGCFRAARSRCRGLLRPCLFADVLQAFRQAVSINPRVLHVFVNVVFRDPYGAPAGPEPHVRQPPRHRGGTPGPRNNRVVRPTRERSEVS